MARPTKHRCVSANPAATVYKPRGIPVWMLEELRLGWDELEAIRLADLEGLYHEEAAMRMGVSRATFGRVLAAARMKVADALLNGKTIIFEGGNITTHESGIFECESCEKTLEIPFGTGSPGKCPHCANGRLYRRRARAGGQTGFDDNRRRRKAYRKQEEKPAHSPAGITRGAPVDRVPGRYQREVGKS